MVPKATTQQTFTCTCWEPKQAKLMGHLACPSIKVLS